MKQTINTPNAPKAIGPYSQAVQAGPFLFCSGQIPLDPASGQIVGSTILEQTERVLRNLEAVLAAAGFSFADAVKTECFLSDMAHFAAFNEVYARYLGEVKPARLTVQAARLPKDVLVEIALTAFRD